MRSVALFGIACDYEEIRHAQSDPDNDRDKKSKIQNPNIPRYPAIVVSRDK